eukprot:11786939-Prorocentrum_lima.AAC.1
MEMLEDAQRLEDTRAAFLDARNQLLSPEYAHMPLTGPDRALRHATAALAQATLLHSTCELLVAHWEFLSLQGQEPIY